MSTAACCVPNSILAVLPEILMQMDVNVTEICQNGSVVTATSPDADTLAEFERDFIHPGSYILTTTVLREKAGNLHGSRQRTVSVRASRIPFLAWLDANNAKEGVTLLVRRQALQEILR